MAIGLIGGSDFIRYGGAVSSCAAADDNNGWPKRTAGKSLARTRCGIPRIRKIVCEFRTTRFSTRGAKGSLSTITFALHEPNPHRRNGGQAMTTTSRLWLESLKVPESDRTVFGSWNTTMRCVLAKRRRDTYGIPRARASGRASKDTIVPVWWCRSI